MVEINLWADKYFTIPEDRKAMVELIKKDKAKFIELGLEALKDGG
jgi:hypothetical protein